MWIWLLKGTLTEHLTAKKATDPTTTTTTTQKRQNKSWINCSTSFCTTMIQNFVKLTKEQSLCQFQQQNAKSIYIAWIGFVLLFPEFLSLYARMCVENSTLNAFVFVYLMLSASHFLVLFIHPFKSSKWMRSDPVMWAFVAAIVVFRSHHSFTLFYSVRMYLSFARFFVSLDRAFMFFELVIFTIYSDLDGIHFAFEFGNISIDFTTDSHLNNRINNTDCIKRIDWFFFVFTLPLSFLCMCVACDAYSFRSFDV